MSERMFFGIVLAVQLVTIGALSGALAYIEGCKDRVAEVLAPENVCHALDGAWIDLGAGQGECLTKEILARLGVK